MAQCNCGWTFHTEYCPNCGAPNYMDRGLDPYWGAAPTPPQQQYSGGGMNPEAILGGLGMLVVMLVLMLKGCPLTSNWLPF